MSETSSTPPGGIGDISGSTAAVASVLTPQEQETPVTSNKPKLDSTLAVDISNSTPAKSKLAPDLIQLVPDESDLAKRQEGTRAELAKNLLVVFGGTVIGSFALLIVITIISAFRPCAPEGKVQQKAPAVSILTTPQPTPSGAVKPPLQAQSEVASTIGCPENKVFQGNSQIVKDLITFLITSQTGLLGTALGFYFGSRTNHSG